MGGGEDDSRALPSLHILFIVFPSSPFWHMSMAHHDGEVDNVIIKKDYWREGDTQ